MALLDPSSICGTILGMPDFSIMFIFGDHVNHQEFLGPDGAFAIRIQVPVGYR